MTVWDKARARWQTKPVTLTEAGCWEWQESRNDNGYGTFHSVLDKAGLAHRFSWMLTNKKLVPRGFVIMHTCDNPPCVNPEHLVLGTYQDNTDDMWAKGRAAYQRKINESS